MVGNRAGSANREHLFQFYDELAIAARELGHELQRPRVDWKYYPLEVIAGPRITGKVIANWRAAKALVRWRCYELFYRRQGRSMS